MIPFLKIHLLCKWFAIEIGTAAFYGMVSVNWLLRSHMCAIIVENRISECSYNCILGKRDSRANKQQNSSLISKTDFIVMCFACLNCTGEHISVNILMTKLFSCVAMTTQWNTFYALMHTIPNEICGIYTAHQNMESFLHLQLSSISLTYFAP